MFVRHEIYNWIDRIAIMPVKYFYPSATAKDTSLPIQEVFECLLDAVNEKMLNIYWEIRCPNLACVRTISIDPYKNTSGYVICPICGEEIEISPEIVFPIFEVSPEYKEYLKKKSHCQKQAPCLC